jgi:hypothetical protein
MNREIRYAVTDLLVESNDDLSPLAAALESAGASVGFYDFSGKGFEFSFHLVISRVTNNEEVASEPETILTDLDSLMRVIQNLDGLALELWKSAPFKFMDPLIEVYQASEMESAESVLQKAFFDFPPDLLCCLAELGVGLRVSICRLSEPRD